MKQNINFSFRKFNSRTMQARSYDRLIDWLIDLKHNLPADSQLIQAYRSFHILRVVFPIYGRFRNFMLLIQHGVSHLDRKAWNPGKNVRTTEGKKIHFPTVKRPKYLPYSQVQQTRLAYVLHFTARLAHNGGLVAHSLARTPAEYAKWPLTNVALTPVAFLHHPQVGIVTQAGLT